MEKSEIAKVIYDLGYFQNLKECPITFLEKKKLYTGFSFQDILDSRSTELIIGFDDNFPLSMPKFFIQDYDSYQFIPHVERDGKVCYTNNDYVFLDTERPGQIILDTYELVKSTIEKGLKKENFIDFTNEFEEYWGRIDGREVILGNLKLATGPIPIKICIQGKIIFAVSDESEYIENISRFVKLGDKGFTQHKGFYVPLNVNSYVIPPRYNEKLNFAYIKHLLTLLDPDSQKTLRKILPGISRKLEYVIFSLMQPNGLNSLFGVKFSKIKSAGHPLLSDEFIGEIIPQTITRVDKDYLYKRGGTGESNSEKKGLIIGGGSVGGFIAEELVRNGFFDLTLVDPDLLSSDNSYRHLTGFTSIGINKAKAIKIKIEKYYPHSNINAIEMRVEEAIKKRKIDFKGFDFIVVATGNVTINTYLNKLFLAEYSGKPVFYSWIDPYGIGGHCLITNIVKSGCYQCLYTSEDFYNLASFAFKKQDKIFLKALSGCGSVYTPYGSIHSLQTSLLTVKKIIDVINGKITLNEIHSWKGDSTIFQREGFKLSERYKMNEIELEERKQSFVNEKCNICQKR